MKIRVEDEVRQWLGAEEDGLDEVAEQALRRALASLERAPRPGFADRVLLRAGRLEPVAGVWRSWWVRFPVAACLLIAGIAAAVLPVALLIVIPLARAFGWPSVVACWHWAARSTTVAFRYWTILAGVMEAIGASLATPEAVAILSANVLLAAASLFGLKRLLKAPEELMPC